MENDSTFVAPEGVYSVTDEHKQTQAQNYAMNIGTSIYPSRISSAIVRFPASKQGSAPGFAQLLGGGGKSESKKDRAVNSKDREDGVSLSSSDTPDESDPQPPASQEQATGCSTYEPHTLFSHPASAKKKTTARPKHSIRTTSSTFITRTHTVEGLSKALQSKQGDVTFLFYNMAKSFAWIEAGSKSKVPSQNSSTIVAQLFAGATFQNHFLSPPHMSRCESIYCFLRTPRHYHWIQYRRSYLVGYALGCILPDKPCAHFIRLPDPINSRYGRLNKQVRCRCSQSLSQNTNH